MSIEITEYPSVSKRAERLGLAPPEGLSILPINYTDAESKEAFLYANTTATVRKLWEENGVLEDPLEKDHISYRDRQQRDISWLAPTIFVSWLLINESPQTVALALNVIGNYISTLFMGFSRKPKISLDIVVETSPTGRTKKIDYRGDVEGLKELPKVIRELEDE